MNQFWKNIAWIILMLLTTALIFSLILQPEEKPEQLSISQVAERIIAGETMKLTVSGNTLEIELADGKKAVSQKESEAGLSETLKNYGVTPEHLSLVALEIKDESGLKFWLTMMLPVLLPLLIIGVFIWIIFKQARTGVNQAFTFGKSNIRLSASFKDRITFKDVAGLNEAKQELIEVVDFLKNPKKYLEIGAKIPRGVILIGPPGTGKTLLARAVAGEAGVPFFFISAAEFVEMFVGVGASRVRDAFATAKKTAPAILFIDELDAVGRERGAGVGGGHDEKEQTLNQILVEMDGFERDTRIIVLAATNRPDILDSALLRPGRFDRRVMLDLPDINDREAILKIHAREKKLAKDVDLRKVAIRTPGFSGADLANLMNEAAIAAAQKDKKEIDQEKILTSIEKVLLGPERKGRVIVPREKEITAYHEAGHALVASALKDADPVQKVSIISRGRAGGYTLKLPLEEMRLKTKSQFLADIAVAFGGYISEKLTFKELTTGSSNDLKQATELAKHLVTRYGMSENLGTRTFGKSEDLMFLGREIVAEQDYSEETARKIDEEVDNFLNHAYKAAEKIIKRHKNALAAIAKTLMEKETLEYEEFNAVIKPFKLQPVKI
ncbi:cell division protein FtsH [Candidatus Wolfebacteria bacterium RIFCSPLOWO2_01_FULL_45_19]|uniref:ATP-dependent zinc metalloprotease FtsH n=1 Tax=Candidatus Wolfebacteria bacterium RIFCSPLOWO2_01_FULL_45_19 TaxID=1802557 RepID=A0A1F8DSR2_9BACT|nr:MAG: ATP-dependent zinc metalloprotease FtsH [Parcubacteria group bacterium GW2011_GWB1_45_9]OGM91502.1 MAG: cell division protein FtsH [Candidatus Wolfebacteria bacterium RIFCSPLOWO2_01_FULL_45_19]